MPVAHSDFHAINDHLLEDFQEDVKEVFASGQYTLGAHVQKFEETFAKFVGCKFGVGLNSGTDALLICLNAIGVGPGDEVVVPVYAPTYTAETVARLGATPVFVDCRPDTLNVDPDQVIASLTSRSKAMIVAHNFGLSCEIDRIIQIARTYSVPVLEDASAAAGGRFHNRRLGTFGNFGCFNLGPGNALGAIGCAGAIVTNDENFVENFRRLRDHGMFGSAAHEMVGYDSHMDALQALFLLRKMSEHDDNNQDRIANAGVYHSMFAGSAVQGPVQREDLSHIYSSFVIQVPDREKLIETLNEKGIESMVPFPTPLHLEPCFRYLEYKEGAFPVAEDVAKRALSIPIGSHLKKSHLVEVANTILSHFGAAV